MKRSLIFFVSFLGLSVSQVFWTSVRAVTLNDFTNSVVEISEPPKRIVTLTPALAELCADLLTDDLNRIVGVSDFTDMPPVLKDRPSVGPYVKVNLEKVIALKPDLVLATKSGNQKEQVERLRDLGIRVLVIQSENFSEIKKSILMVGEALHRADMAQKIKLRLDTGLDHIKRRYSHFSQKKVLLQVGGEPLVVVGGKSFLNEALELLSAKNVYRDLKWAYPRPALEDVIQKKPEVIVVMAMGKNLGRYKKMKTSWMSMKRAIPAAQSHRVHLIRGDAILRPSLRLLEGLDLLGRAIYSEEQTKKTGSSG